MRIAKYIDPAVFYDKNVANPYIMSPYLASVNTLSAWPAPHRSHDAVLALENGNAEPDSDDEPEEAAVPREIVPHTKKSLQPVPIRYWSFQGFREEDTNNTLQRKPTRESLRQIEDAASIDANPAREGSIRTQSTKYDDERLVTSEHPTHRLALTRLGSYGRGSVVPRSSIIGDTPPLGSFPEISSSSNDDDEEDNDDDNDSFYTAAEYIFENELQPDGTIKPVKKQKSGLTVKKVRKSLHIPFAKTVQKNMRSLSIKRKDRGDKRTESIGTDVSTPEGSRASTELPTTRKSIDLMRPFRFGHHDKEGNPRKSLQLDREVGNRTPSATLPRSSMTEERTLVTSSVSRPSIDAQKTVISDHQIAKSGSVMSESIHSPVVPQSLPSISTRSYNKSQHNNEILSPRSDASIPLGSVLTSSSTASITSGPILVASSKPVQPILRTSVGPEPVPMEPELLKGSQSSRSPPTDGISHRLDQKLGPWRFSDPKVEPIEDTAFIFGDTTHSVKARRKYFAKSAENRRLFEFDTDIVYCMSFFLPYMNFNTFDIKLGPLGANLHKYVDDQPIRYMARNSEKPDEVYFMVEFNLE